MSVVILVIKDEDWNLSIFLNENSCIFLYKSLLKLAPIPKEALAANLPPRIPLVKDKIENPTRTRTIPKTDRANNGLELLVIPNPSLKVLIYLLAISLGSAI